MAWAGLGALASDRIGAGILSLVWFVNPGARCSVPYEYQPPRLGSQEAWRRHTRALDTRERSRKELQERPNDIE